MEKESISILLKKLKNNESLTPDELGRLFLHLLYEIEDKKYLQDSLYVQQDVIKQVHNLNSEEYEEFHEYKLIFEVLIHLVNYNVDINKNKEIMYLKIVHYLNMWACAEEDYIYFSENNLKDKNKFSDPDAWQHGFISETLIDKYKEGMKDILNALIELYQKSFRIKETINIISKIYEVPNVKKLINKPDVSKIENINNQIEYTLEHIIRTQLLDNEMNKEELMKEFKTFLQPINIKKLQPSRTQISKVKNELENYQYQDTDNFNIENFLFFLWNDINFWK